MNSDYKSINFGTIYGAKTSGAFAPPTPCIVDALGALAADKPVYNPYEPVDYATLERRFLEHYPKVGDLKKRVAETLGDAKLTAYSEAWRVLYGR